MNSPPEKIFAPHKEMKRLHCGLGGSGRMMAGRKPRTIVPHPHVATLIPKNEGIPPLNPRPSARSAVQTVEILSRREDFNRLLLLGYGQNKPAVPGHPRSISGTK
jgi:hypothetical protein